jgi:hypothetical protein
MADGANSGRAARTAPVGLLLSLVLVPFGIAFGLIYAEAAKDGVGLSWRQLPQPPLAQFTLTASREGSLFVTTTSGEVLQCCSGDGGRWFASSVPPDINDGWTIIHPCTQSGPEWWFISTPPTDRLDCIEDNGIHAEFGSRNVYVVDQSWRIWAWQNQRAGWDNIGSCLTGQLCGIFAALLAAMAASPLVSKTRFFDDRSSPPAA